MPGYLIADIEITDQDMYDEYGKVVPATIEKYGGEYIIRGGTAEALEGDWNPKRIVVLKFESLDKAKEWYNSEEYQAILRLRTNASNGNAIMVETP
jgi:uncharacterized protein (DUF1330 family)